MKKSIKELKMIIKDGMTIQHKSGSIDIIRRGNNNDIRLHGRLISWSNLYDILANGDELVINELQEELPFLSKKNKRGGYRPGAGRPKSKKPKKKVVSFALTGTVHDKLKLLSKYQGVSLSKFVSMLISQEFVQKNDYVDFINFVNDQGKTDP